jgi:hypothetical protein
MGERRHNKKGNEKEEKVYYTKDLFSPGRAATLILIVEIIVIYFTVKEILLWEDLVYNILVGLGCVFLLSALPHSIIPKYRRPILGKSLQD